MFRPADSIWRNGEVIPWEEATVHILAQSLQRGTLVFDFMSIKEDGEGRFILRLTDHVRRFEASLSLIGFQSKVSMDAIEAGCIQMTSANDCARVIKVSAVISTLDPDVLPGVPEVDVFIASYDPGVNVGLDAPAVRAAVEPSCGVRSHFGLSPHAKVAANYAGAMVAKAKARARGADEVILLDENGCIAEAPTSNIFVSMDGNNLITPRPENVLNGITRDTLLEIARAYGIAIEERDITRDELGRCRSAFLSRTTTPICEITSLDGRALAIGDASAPTAALRRRYADMLVGGRDVRPAWKTYV